MKKLAEGRQLTDGDQQTFYELYMKIAIAFIQPAFEMTQNISESEDLTHDVFIQLFRTIESLRGESQFTTWLHGLTVNQK